MIDILTDDLKYLIDQMLVVHVFNKWSVLQRGLISTKDVNQYDLFVSEQYNKEKECINHTM